MCLIVIAHEAHAQRPLVVAANRDEAYARRTDYAHFWDDHPGILAGRDLEAGGTWLGIDRRGRFAAITNFREMGTRISAAPTRGKLAGDFLIGEVPAEAYLQAIAETAQTYNGFNLLVRDDSGLFYLSNRSAATDAAPRLLPPGIYGLSNHLLDTPWPKVVQAKQRFAQAVAQQQSLTGMMAILRDDAIAEDAALPDTGVGAMRERLLSPIFIAADSYGTRCSTLLEVSSARRVRFMEQNFAQGGVATDAVEYRFELDA